MKRRYIRCVDCRSELSPAGVVDGRAVYCWHCANYDVEVVLAYD